MATPQQKREELARGAALLDLVNNEFDIVQFNQASPNKFYLEYNGDKVGAFVWRLFDNGIGTVKWLPVSGYKDIAPKRNMERYDYTDGETDIFKLIDFLKGILTDLGIA